MLNLPQAKEFGIETSRAKEIAAQFKPMLAKMEELEEQSNEIKRKAAKEITPELSQEAKELRLQYVKIRTGTAAIHKEQKAFYLAAGRFVDGWKNAQVFASKGAEEELKTIEDYFERLEQERKEKLAANRWEQLSPYREEPPSGLAEMEEDVFQAFLTMAKQNHEDQLRAEQEAERLREIALLDKERRYQVARLQNFWPNPMPNLGELTEDEFKQFCETLNKSEAAYIKEQEKARRQAEEERKAREKAEAEAAKIRKEAEEREAKARKEAFAEAEKKRQAELAEQEKLIQAEQAKREARSDAEKLKEFASLRHEAPNVKSKEAKDLIKEYLALLDKAEKWLNNKADALK